MIYTLLILIIIFSIYIQTLQQYAFLLLHACDMTCVTTHASSFYILKIYLVKHTLLLLLLFLFKNLKFAVNVNFNYSDIVKNLMQICLLLVVVVTFILMMAMIPIKININLCQFFLFFDNNIIICVVHYLSLVN